MNEPKPQPQSLRELLAQLDAEGITDYRRYQAVRRFLGFKARDRGVPISGIFELTPLCNLDCKMCYVHLRKEQMRGAQLLSTEQWKSIMQQAIDAGMMFASLTGGECLTYPGFRELYLFLMERGIQVSILSNGRLMDEDMVDFLRQTPPALIQITLYGASEEGYERVTGHRAFRQVRDSLHRLKEAGLPFCVAITPNQFMCDCEAVIRMLHEEGFPFQINAGLMKPREETERGLADADLDTYVALYKLQRQLKGTPVEPACELDSLPEPGHDTSASPRGVRCGAGRSGFSVDWRGGMQPCNTFPCAPENVLQLGFDEAWKRTHQTATTFPLPSECEGCSYKAVCHGCVAEHAAGAAVGHASPAVCMWGQRMIAEGLRLLPSKS